MIRLLALALLLPATALAADGPCHDDGDYVICERPGFDELTTKCRGFKRSAQECAVRLEQTEAYLRELEALIDEFQPVCPTCNQPVPAVKQSGQRQMWGYALGILGTAAVLVAPAFPQMGVSAQTVTVVGGLTLLTTGFIVNLTFD